MIEVELRGLLNRTQYGQILDFLEINGQGYEEDHKIAHYFGYSDGILKVVNEQSKGSYKLSLKQGNEYAGMGLEELDVYLSSKEDFSRAISLLEQLGFVVKSIVPQQRVNAIYKNVHFAIKHTPSWGYHFEAEMIVDDFDKASQAHNYIEGVCRELNLKPLSESQLRDFIAKL